MDSFYSPQGDSAPDPDEPQRSGPSNLMKSGVGARSPNEGTSTRPEDAHIHELMAQGGLLYEQFQATGVVEKMNGAIQCWGLAASLTPNSYPGRPGILNNLGCAYKTLFEWIDKLQFLEKSIEYGVEANLLAPENHPDKSNILNSLSNAYITRFERLGDLADVNKAIEYGAQAVSLTPNHHPNKPSLHSNLGDSYLTRFKRLGKLVDLSKAIESGTQAVSLTPAGDPDQSGFLNFLGSSYLARFERLGEPVDLNNAIECGTRALLLSSDGHPDRPSILNNLQGSLMARFNHRGELADLGKAIECGTLSVSLTPVSHPNRPNRLHNLGESYHTRFKRLGEPTDLNKAIECKAQAVSLTPNGHLDRPSRLDSFGNSHLTRFKCLGKMADLENAITCGAQAVLLTIDGHPDKPGILNNLGGSHLARFNHLGELTDLNKAIESGVQALSLIPDDHPVKPSILNYLGSSYTLRFKRLGELADLNRAIAYGVQAYAIIPDGHVERTSLLNNLGVSYMTRFKRLGELVDLSKAIQHGAQAVSLIPDGHEDKANMFSNLGNSYRARFERLGELVDLNEAIKYGNLGYSLTPNNHPDKPSRLNTLGILHYSRFRRIGDIADLNHAITHGAEAVSLTPDDHASKLARLNNLGNSYLNRFKSLGELADLNEAIKCGAQAILLTPEGHPNKPGLLNNLGASYLTRFKSFGELEDLKDAIKCGDQAVLLTPDGHSDKPDFFNNLGDCYSTRFGRLHQASDLESAITCFKSAAQYFSGPPYARFNACRAWARLAARQEMSSSFPAYQQAIELLPQLIWIGTTLDRRYSLIADLGDFATEAAAYAISINDLTLALEWLEAGRSIVWGQIAQLRNPFDQLSLHSSDLANKLKEISHKLEQAGSRLSSTPFLKVIEENSGQESSDHIQLAIAWETHLSEARSIPGFEDFLCPPKAAKLMGAAKSHPIAIINVHESRCDALILEATSSVISHVPLKEFSVSSAIIARTHLASQVRQRKIGHLKGIGSLEKSLQDLWTSVLEPVLGFLGYMNKLPIGELPRLTWCTTGLLSFLPLHAAGRYDGSHYNALDLVVSSYTPTLTALLAHKSTTPSIRSKVLAVSQEHTPGMDSLPGTRDELAIIKKHMYEGCCLQLQNEEATLERVLDAMDQFGWVHMACHGSQDTTDPTQSAFHLHDGSLTLAMITKRSFTNKGLAFLSACQTATGDKDIPEEAVHLAAGMLIAGFPSVIATMWSIADEDGPRVADEVYASLLKNGGNDHTNAARALHEGVIKLRATVGETSFERWAPFIHLGS